MRKKKVNKYPTAFRKMALERLKTCKSATDLAAELGVHRTQLYKWRDQMEPVDDGHEPCQDDLDALSGIGVSTVGLLAMANTVCRRQQHRPRRPWGSFRIRMRRGC